MKNIRNYQAEKYASAAYVEVETGICKWDGGFVTSLCFEQEPELGEGASSADISQYPLEDLLDRFYVSVSDHYDAINARGSKTCCLEFCGETIEDVRKLRSIIGKHVYNRDIGDAVDLVVE